jgi:hypothetical protein
METTKVYENFPARIVIASNFVTLSIWGLGCFVMFQAGLIYLVLFLIYFLALEYRLLGSHCINCYYYGKTCGFGQGRISSLFFKKGDNSKFCAKAFTWKDLIPDLLISLIPLIAGIVLLVIKFNILVLFSLVLLIVLSTAGNSYVRGSLTCKHCKQRELGCLALELFNKQ